MEITINIPDDKKDAVVDAFAIQYKYPKKTQDEDGNEIINPVSKGQFALNIINSFIKEVYVASKISPLEDQRKTIIETATTEIEGVTVQ